MVKTGFKEELTMSLQTRRIQAMVSGHSSPSGRANRANKASCYSCEYSLHSQFETTQSHHNRYRNSFSNGRINFIASLCNAWKTQWLFAINSFRVYLIISTASATIATRPLPCSPNTVSSMMLLLQHLVSTLPISALQFREMYKGTIL